MRAASAVPPVGVLEIAYDFGGDNAAAARKGKDVALRLKELGGEGRQATTI